MHKLTLALDDLVVETFAPAARPVETGTVHANNSGPYTDECYNCLNTDYDCDAGSFSACPCTHTCYNHLTCGANTCDAGYTCDGETCFQATCSFPECTKAGIPC
jgi:hypothetical protein